MVFRPRVSGKKLYHHIYAWGNDRHPIFKKDMHYQQYLRLLKKYAAYFRMEVIAYALMEWHVHLFIYDVDDKISDFFLHFHGDYARYYNRVTKRVGHVFGERFNNKIVQPNNYALWLSRYIHRQPVEAGIIDRPENYQWTSYRIYLGLDRNEFLRTSIILEQFGNGAEASERYAAFVLGDEAGPVDWRTLKQQIIGDDDFMTAMIDENADEIEINKDDMGIEDVVTRMLGMEMASLKNPKGRKERSARHKVMKELAMKYHFSKSEIARALDVSVAAVSKVAAMDI